VGKRTLSGCQPHPQVAEKLILSTKT
jgi:hypothetical protein